MPNAREMVWWKACYIINHRSLIVSRLVEAHKWPTEYPLYLMQVACKKMQNGLPENLFSVSLLLKFLVLRVLKVCGQEVGRG